MLDTSQGSQVHTYIMLEKGKWKENMYINVVLFSGFWIFFRKDTLHISDNDILSLFHPIVLKQMYV